VDPQNAAERAHAEQLLRVFGQSTDYITHCKVCTGLHKINVKFCYFLSLLSCDGSLLTDSQQHEVLQAILDNSQSPYAQLLASSSLLKVITDHTLRYGLSNCQDSFDIFLQLQRSSALSLSHAMLCSVPVKLEMRNYFMTYLDRYARYPPTCSCSACLLYQLPVKSFADEVAC